MNESISNQEPTNQAPVVDTPPESIGMSDLDALKQIVAAAISRGAFEASEVERVGAVYNKLNNFLEGVAAAQAAQEPSAEEEEAMSGKATDEGETE